MQAHSTSAAGWLAGWLAGFPSDLPHSPLRGPSSSALCEPRMPAQLIRTSVPRSAAWSASLETACAGGGGGWASVVGGKGGGARQRLFLEGK
jgi:hypothetical protein